MKLAALLFLALNLGAQQPGPFETHLAAGKNAVRQSRYADADQQLRAAIEDSQSFNPNDPSTAPRMAEALDTLCDLDLLIGKYDEAVSLAERAVAVVEKSDSRVLTAQLTRLAGAYRADNQTAKAEPVLQRVLSLDVMALGADDPKVATDYDSLGSAYVELHSFEEGRAAYEKALESRMRRLAENDLEIANSWVNLAILEEKDKKPDAARTDLEKALAVTEKKVGDESYSLTGILDRLGLLLRQMRNYSEAEPVLQRSLAIREKTLGARHSDLAPALDNLALTYFSDKKFIEAEPLFVRSSQIWLAAQGPWSPLYAQSLDNLGSVYSAQQRFDEAEPLFKRALGIREQSDIESLTNLALIYQAKNDAKNAELYFQRAILIGEKGLGGDHSDQMSATLDDYETFLTAVGRVADAKKLAAHIRELSDHKVAETAPNAHKGDK